MNMLDVTEMKHHPAVEEIAETIGDEIQNQDYKFFRQIVNYFVVQVASSMRAKVSAQHHKSPVPVNQFTTALGPSGSGKGYSTGAMETRVINGFRSRFLEETFPQLAERNLWKISQRRAAKKGTEEQEEFLKVEKEYNSVGEPIYVFDSGSTPAMKQYRHKLLMAGAGAVNFQADEIGSNYTGLIELLTSFLELYDTGKIKDKIKVNNTDQKRLSHIDGETPANMLLFGTGSKLLDGGKIEEEFLTQLEAGQARRNCFAYGIPRKAVLHENPEELLDSLMARRKSKDLTAWQTHFTHLADESKVDWLAEMDRDVTIAFLTYQSSCEAKAAKFSEQEPIRKYEMEHRHTKVLKIAGAYAFIDEANFVSMANLQAAIKIVEESGEAFDNMMNRPKNYMRLAQFIADSPTPLNHAELAAQTFVPNSASPRKEMIDLAIAWGYSNNIVIKRGYLDGGIEVFDGDTIQPTDIDALNLSYSSRMADDYEFVEAPFNQLSNLVTQGGLNWANHAFYKNHRSEEDCIPGFNMLVLDCDGGTSLDMVHSLLGDYAMMTHTTKSHTEDDHRFRLVIPMNYELALNKEDYTVFMNNIYDWLPFKVDRSTIDRSRKWATTQDCEVRYSNSAKLLDILSFIPRSSRNNDRKAMNKDLKNLAGLERYFAERMISGENRNHMMLRFALTLVDSGLGYVEVENKVLEFNRKLSDPLPVEELRSTVLVTAGKRLDGID